MKTYKYKKEDGSLWMFYYDTNIRLWTVFEIHANGDLLSEEADHYYNRWQMLQAHGFNFKIVLK
jgi:hypothetical protein